MREDIEYLFAMGVFGTISICTIIVVNGLCHWLFK